MTQGITTRHWRLGGRVQGVGFRPFVYRVARAHGLRGWVRNRLGEVEILAQGPEAALTAFEQALLQDAPPLAEPRLEQVVQDASEEQLETFVILDSAGDERPRIHVPPDYFTCADCIRELEDSGDRRHRYPFINCTQCGPRYTLIRTLPYDRANTSMAAFLLCPPCAQEYQDPADRRFHAEPLACPVCGPALTFRRGEQQIEGNEPALAAATAALRAGQVVAAKGIGGYHLLCDASNEMAVARLRNRKPRPHKPLAVLFPPGEDHPLVHLKGEVELTAEEASLLASPVRPIVLARKAGGGRLAVNIAPGLAEVGVMLPYSPLHHLLVRDFGGPLVATSGNLSGEPVLTESEEAERRLDRVADGFLHHDRPILRPADDAVYRTTGGRPRPLRLGRGSAPLELELPAPLAQPTLAVGGHLKACIALAWERRLVVSPHIGDMGTLRSQQVFEQLVQDLQALYRVEARRLVCDAHPDYSTHRWARRDGRPLHRVLHHHAHASALAGEAEWDRPGLVFTWDGTGLGEDGSLWGGELFYGLPGAWERVGRLRPFRLPGGELAGRAPWRSAAALLWETGLNWAGLPSASELAHQAWRRGINAPPSSAAGRLFDAAASLCGLVQEASFEGQGPMYLEALVRAPGEPCELPLRRTPEGLWELDWAPLLPRLLEPGIGPQRKAENFHSSLALALRRQAQQLARERAVERVGLCGGVFQNRVLVDQARAALAEAGFAVDLPLQLPANDAAIAFGQIQEQLARDQSR